MSAHGDKLKPFVLDEENRIIYVCAWCFPRGEILNRFPHLRGLVAVSHTICADHKAAFENGKLLQ